MCVCALYAGIKLLPFPSFHRYLFLPLAQVTALEEEVRHLNHKVRAHQEEARRLTEKVRDIERLKDQKEEEQQQLRDRLRVSRQQVRVNSPLSYSPLLM